MQHHTTSSALTGLLFEPVHIAPLVFFRIAFGLLLFIECLGAILIGFVQEVYIDPVFYFSYLGFEWVRPLPGNGMIYLYLFMALLAFCIMVGLKYRVACALFFLCFTWAFLVDKTHYINHHYLIVLYSFLLIFLPAHRCCSVDARLNPSMRRTVVPYWPVFLIVFQIAVVHLFAAFAKLYPDWLQAQPLLVWLGQKTHFPVIGYFFQFPETAFVYAYGGILFDLLILPAMLWERTRVAAFIVAVVFHMLNLVTFLIGIFPFLALAATALFFPPRKFMWLTNRLGRLDAAEPEAHDRTEGSVFPVKAAVVVLCAGWVAFQTVLPLRPYLYGTDTEWTEKGHMFSWRMMLRSKAGSAVFHVEFPEETKAIPADEFLTRPQARLLPSRPEMIHQMSRFLRDHFEAEGRRVVAVRINSHVSLNGRPLAPFADPGYNLLEHEWRKCSVPPWLRPKPE